MVLAAIPRPFNVNNNATGTSNQHWQDSRTTATARQSVKTRIPQGTIMEMFYGNRGLPSKAYLRDGQGKLMTVTFNASQQVASMQNGCH